MSPTANSIVTLELCDYIWGCYDHVRKVHVAVEDPQREVFTDSANFVLPPHWTQEIEYYSTTGMILRGITLKATVEPYYPSSTMDYAEIDWSDNEFSQSFDFSYTTDLTVWSVRVGEQITSYYDPLQLLIWNTYPITKPNPSWMQQKCYFPFQVLRWLILENP